MDIREWNCRLVGALFHERLDVSPEIRRIDATDGFLAAAGGFTDAASARRSFLAAMPHTEDGVRALFNVDILDSWTIYDEELPFYSQLHLTILAASADETLHEEGNFRRRLAQMLDLHQDKDFVSNGCLPLLWQKVERWSALRAARHQDTRQLVLPDPKGETLIGYSKRLAFPSFRDQNRLASLFTKAGVDASSPLLRFIGVLRSGLGDFSERFREEFEHFVSLCEKRDRFGAMDTPFWAAVIETTWLQERREERGQIQSCRLEIDPTDPFAPGFWLYCSAGSQGGSGWTVDHRDKLSNGLASCRHSTATSLGVLLELLRTRWRAVQNRDWIGNRLGERLGEGCICFTQDDDGRWFDTPIFPSEGLIWFALHTRNESLLDAPGGRNLDEVVYRARLQTGSGWTLFGPLELTDGVRGWFETHGFGLDFFAPRLVRRRITVAGVIRLTDSTHLYAPPLVPTFRCADACAGEVEVEDGQDGSSYDLRLQDDRLVLPETANLRPRPDLLIRVAATDVAGRRIAATRFRFRDTSTVLALKDVRSPSSWLESGLSGRLEPYSAQPVVATPVCSGDVPAVADRPLRPLTRVATTAIAPERLDPKAVDERWGRATEILTAVLARRYAWPVSECIKLLTAIWGSRAEAWARLIDLVENGAIRLLHNRHWSSRVIVARHPVVVYREQTDTISLRIVGLMSTTMRALADSVLGASCQQWVSPDHGTAGALVYNLACTDQLDALRAETNWSMLSWSTLPVVVLPRIEDVTATFARMELEDYDEEKKTTWSIRHRVFVGDAPSSSILPRLERWRADGQQDLYVLYRKDGVRWNTDCRGWALLVFTAELAGVIGEIQDVGTAHLTDPSLALPKALAWSTVALGGGVCFRMTDGTRVYPAGQDWSVSDACEDWIGGRPSPQNVINGRLRAQARYGSLIDRERRRRSLR